MKATEYIVSILEQGKISRADLKAKVTKAYSPSTYYTAITKLVSDGKAIDTGAEYFLPGDTESGGLPDVMETMYLNNNHFVHPESEQQILAMLINLARDNDKKNFENIVMYLRRGAIYNPMLGGLYEKITSAYDGVSPHTAISDLKLTEQEAKFISSDYVNSMKSKKNNAVVSLLNSRARRRIAISEITQALEDFVTDGKEDSFIEKITDVPSVLIRGKSTDHGLSLKEAADLMVDRVSKIIDGDYESKQITTGYDLIDRRFGRLRGGQLHVLAARPGVGKTTMMLNHAIEISKKGYGVGVFSLEMSTHELMSKLYSKVALIPLRKLYDEALDKGDLASIHNANAEIYDLKMYINDHPYQTPNKLRNEISMLIQRQPCDIVMIDYLQLLNHERNFYSTNEKLETITREIKIIAKDFDIPIILLSQLNRRSGRYNKENDGVSSKPFLTDLRGSGSIEQDADTVSFMYEQGTDNDDGVIRYMRAKNRMGKTGEITLDVNFALSTIKAMN